jgi:hypothetical protein
MAWQGDFWEWFADDPKWEEDTIANMEYARDTWDDDGLANVLYSKMIEMFGYRSITKRNQLLKDIDEVLRAKSREWAQQLKQDVLARDVLAEMTGFVKEASDAILANTPDVWTSFVSTVKEYLPSKQLVDKAGFTLASLPALPFIALGYLGEAIWDVGAYALNALYEKIVTEEVKMVATAGLGLTAVGVAYNVLKED